MLFAADQLNYVMTSGAAFSGYTEGAIAFRPTYKYDVGTDNYDTSEKRRIPAWTGLSPSCRLSHAYDIIFFFSDRVLYRGSNLDLSVYSRAELNDSDHRPGKIPVFCQDS